MYKLSLAGFSGKLLSCLSSFLTNRTQWVRVGNSFSDEGKVKSGVSPGSVLGPILLIVFINDISTFIGSESEIKLFADDLKSYSSTLNDQDSVIFTE